MSRSWEAARLGLPVRFGVRATVFALWFSSVRYFPGTGRGRRCLPVSNRSSPSLGSPRLSLPLDSPVTRRSEEHTSELQSRQYLVCRLLLEKKKKKTTIKKQKKKKKKNNK